MSRKQVRSFGWFYTSVVACLLTASTTVAETPRIWKRHTIDNSSRGADGARPLDVNGDGLLDLATGWEEGGLIRAYIHPGKPRVRQPWPAVSIGKVRSPEDAVFVDLDGDGNVDVVSSCEGRQKTMFVHWAPADRRDYLDPTKWVTEALPDSMNKQSWMFCVPLDVDGQHGVDLVTGSKAADAHVGWFQAPADRRNLKAWKWHPLCRAGWIMSLITMDVDHDGDLDIVMSDRKGSKRGCYWLSNPGKKAGVQTWEVRPIGALGLEVIFMAIGDLNGDGLTDFVVPVRGGDIQVLLRTKHATPQWSLSTIAMPPNTGTGKGAAIADVDLDGRMDVVYSCENSAGKIGVGWLSRTADQAVTKPNWTSHDISGSKDGVKFDLIEMIDLDGDGDLDVVTCEERHNLGVIWFENPTR
ncbi:MAG: VCBS repeat-containing protein [Planctomycetota bacterium]|nr:VCBS repeat-containing protein [Planctomycetota bacterium]